MGLFDFIKSASPNGRISSAERKTKTETLLKSLNIPFIDHLPLVAEEEDIVLRSPQEIARRAIVLVYLCYAADFPESKNQVISFLKEKNLWNSVSQEEQELFGAEITRQQQIDLSWRAEATWLLLWTINKVKRLELPTRYVNVGAMMDLFPGFMKDPGKFIESARLRPVSEILDVLDLTYRLHWATRDAQLKSLPPLKVDAGIVEERHYAINWVTCYAEDWDDISTDT